MLFRSIMHHRDGNTAGTVLVGGTGGGIDGPASIYRDMGTDLLNSGISSLRLDFRMAGQLEECVLDTLMGIEFLKELGISEVGLVGWSFGGAVVIEAGADSDAVRAVVTVASQTYGTESVARLSPKALLLLHGTADRTLPPSCSSNIYERAKEPKEIIFYDGGNHGIDQSRDQMLRKIESFLITHLANPDEDAS